MRGGRGRALKSVKGERKRRKGRERVCVIIGSVYRLCCLFAYKPGGVNLRSGFGIGIWDFVRLSVCLSALSHD